ncbi:hypothetical protein D3C84_1179110 [compost metagenome]
MCSRRVSISGVTPENSSTTPDRNTSTARIGAAKPDAARRVWRVWNSRCASLISSSTQATSIGSST